MMGGGGIEYPLYLVNGRPADDPESLAVRRGEKVRLRIINAAAETLFRFAADGHPLTVTHADGLPGPFKDTAMVDPHMGRLAFDFVADNPGEWFFHCHNAYHMESGMARVVSYGP